MKNALASLKLLLALTILTGLIYPAFVTLVGRITFPHATGGSLILRDGRVVGSALIGQKFSRDGYFWSRPSAIDYNPLPSGGSNLGPTSKKLVEQIAKFEGAVPPDLKFASASGLDPHVTVDAALTQVTRVLKARDWEDARRPAIEKLIRQYTAPREFGALGEERVNVLELNLALDRMG